MITITKDNARKLLLKKHGLYGEYIFSEKEGIYSFIEQVGCIQYDPIDVCGKNHELVLQSRVKGFKKDMLHELLYKDRCLVDWFDKNQAIMPISDWPYFEYDRKQARENSRHKDEVDKVSGDIIEQIRKSGEICSSDLEHKHKVDWWWSPTSLARAALEMMYLRGELVISNKKNTRRYYALAEDIIPEEILESSRESIPEKERIIWQVKRRIGAVGMLKCKASDAFLGIRRFKAADRNMAFSELIKRGEILPVEVENSNDTFYILASDKHLIEEVLTQDDASDRLEFIAPLDNLIWDRKIIDELFGFSYKWEIYTPIKDRKYGYYVLPILYNDKFIGRIELKRDRKKKKIEKIGFWWEDKAYNTPDMRKMVREKVKEFNNIMY